MTSWEEFTLNIKSNFKYLSAISMLIIELDYQVYKLVENEPKLIKWFTS